MATVDRLAERGTGLLITVDCGITSAAEVAAARSRGIEAVVTDHHQPGDELPDCPVVHPVVSGYPCPDLCAAGVAHKLAAALAGGRARGARPRPRGARDRRGHGPADRREPLARPPRARAGAPCRPSRPAGADGGRARGPRAPRRDRPLLPPGAADQRGRASLPRRRRGGAVPDHRRGPGGSDRRGARPGESRAPPDRGRGPRRCRAAPSRSRARGGGRAGDRAVGRGLAPRRGRHLCLAHGRAAPEAGRPDRSRRGRPGEGIRAERPGVRPVGGAAGMRGTHWRATGATAPRPASRSNASGSTSSERRSGRTQPRRWRGIPQLAARRSTRWSAARASGTPSRTSSRPWARSARATRRSACWSPPPGSRTSGRWARSEKHARFSLASGPARASGVAFGVGGSLARAADAGPADVSVRLELNEWNGAVSPRIVLGSVYAPPLAAHGEWLAGDEEFEARFTAEFDHRGTEGEPAVLGTRPRAGRPDPGIGRGVGRRAGVERGAGARWSARTPCGGGRSSRTRRVPRDSGAARRRSSRRADPWRRAARSSERLLAGERGGVALADWPALALAPELAGRFTHVVLADPAPGPRVEADRAGGRTRRAAATPTCSARTGGGTRRPGAGARLPGPRGALDVPIARWPSRATAHSTWRACAPDWRPRASRTRPNGAPGRSASWPRSGWFA